MMVYKTTKNKCYRCEWFCKLQDDTPKCLRGHSSPYTCKEFCALGNLPYDVDMRKKRAAYADMVRTFSVRGDDSGVRRYEKKLGEVNEILRRHSYIGGWRKPFL